MAARLLLFGDEIAHDVADVANEARACQNRVEIGFRPGLPSSKWRKVTSGGSAGSVERSLTVPAAEAAGQWVHAGRRDLP
jgi:hypothetical protein